MNDSDFSYAKSIEYMDKLVLELMKEGKEINEILDMPFNYVMDLLSEKNKPKKATSVMDLP